MSFYIIEHPHLGILTEDSLPAEPHWSWSCTRNSSRAMRFKSYADATAALERYVPRENMREDSSVMRSPAQGQHAWTIAHEATEEVSR